MIVKRIEVKNFLSHADSQVDFCDAPLWLIAGDNGSGKSALFDALEYALYGQHRGDKTSAELLVKKGERTAMITVVFQLKGEQLRVTHEISSQRGNQGGRLYVWDEALGAWVLRNVGDGRRAVWEWLQQRLPQHEHFRSAVFLRQNETAHFLRGTTAHRSKRFAALVNLQRYTELSERARGKADAAKEARQRAETTRNDLGDLSDECLQQLEADVKSATQQRQAAIAAYVQARERTEAAREWARLQVSRADLEQQQCEVNSLLSEEQQIRDASDAVQAWDASAADLRQYWSHRDAAIVTRSAAERKREAATRADDCRATFKQKLERIAERLRLIDEQELPAVQDAVEQSTALHRQIAHEYEVAKARVELELATAQVEQLSGADQQLEHWQERAAALPRLEAVARARTNLIDLAGLVPARKAHYDQACERFNAAQAAQDQVEQVLAEIGRRWDEHKASMATLSAEIARLEAQVDGHMRLTGNERHCPVCIQRLDAAAHEHVREVLAVEHETLAAKQIELQEQALPQLECDKRDFEIAEQKKQANSEQLETARQTLEHARTDLHTAKTQLKNAEEALKQVLDELLKEYPQHLIAPDEINATTVAAEREAIKTMLEPAKEVANKLNQARTSVMVLEGPLRILRKQRDPNVEQIGDSLSPDAVAVLRDALVKEKADHQCRLEALKDERDRLVNEQTANMREDARLDVEAETAREQANNLDQEVTVNEEHANIIADSLRSVWQSELQDKGAYQQKSEAIAKLRPTAALIDDLKRASWERDKLIDDLRRVAIAEEQIDPLDRLPVSAAKAEEGLAQQAVIEMNSKYDVATQAVDNFLSRRRREQDLRVEIEALNDEHKVFSELADLLKEHGPIQRAIAEQEQRRVAQEANEILKLLNDPLRIRIDQARRGGEDQDVTIIDVSDLANDDGGSQTGSRRYFEFLSGGEQFRIALALALALHRRLGGGEPGTVIVDEGFGALDGDRRDALALQMTDTSHGILGLGLAHSLIICSHAAEVQRHFPNRWVIEKRAGTASVRRDDGALV